jgi:hypothetical protein
MSKPHQIDFIRRLERKEIRCKSANLQDAATAGLLRTWSTALANNWPHLAELTCEVLEENIKRGAR